MKKVINFSIMSIFLLVLTLGLTSAFSASTNGTTNLAQSDGSFTLTITGSIGEVISYNISDLNDGKGNKITFTPQSNSLNTSVSNSTTINYALGDFYFSLGQTYSTTINVTNGTNTQSLTFSFKETDYCGSTKTIGSLDLEIEDVQVISGFGEDDDFWYLMDEVEVEVTVTNDGNYDMSDITLEWALYTSGNKKISEDEVDEFDLDEDDDTTLTFTITLNEDIEEFDGKNAILYIRAIGKIDDSDSSNDGENTCVTEKISSDVITSDNFVVLNNFEINDIESVEELVEGTFSCGSQVTLRGEAWNIGEDDEDEVSLEIYSKELGVHEEVELGDIDAYDSSEFSFTFNVPENLDEKNYRISFEVYDEDNDLFENKEDDKSVFYKYFTVTGNCKIVKPEVSAKLETEAIAGKEMIIKSSVTNKGTTPVTYTIVAENYEAFGKLESITPEVVALQAGETKEIEFKFSLNKEALGENSFNIVVNQNNKAAEIQPVLVTIEKSTFSVSDVIKNKNAQIAGIVLLNVILVLAIVLVARKILKRK